MNTINNNTKVKIKYEIYPELVQLAMQFKSIGTYRLFFFLLDNASSDEDQENRWSTNKICKETNITKMTFLAARRELEELGIITVTRRKSKNGSFLNNTYTLNKALYLIIK